MTNTQFPSFNAAQEADAAAAVTGRPQWAKDQYNLEKGKGRVTAITEATRMTANGNAIIEYQIHLGSPVIERANLPLTGEAILVVPSPNTTSRLGSRQPYFWTLEGPHEADPSIDNLGQLVGKDIAFELQARKPFPTAERDAFFYKLALLGGGTASNGTKAVSDERLAEAAVIVAGLSHKDAMDALGEDGSAVLSKLVLTKVVKQDGGVYVAVE